MTEALQTDEGRAQSTSGAKVKRTKVGSGKMGVQET